MVGSWFLIMRIAQTSWKLLILLLQQGSLAAFSWIIGYSHIYHKQELQYWHLETCICVYTNGYSQLQPKSEAWIKVVQCHPNLIIRLSESYNCSVTLVAQGTPPISGKKRATEDPLVSKRPDFQGLSSYLRGSHGLSARRTWRTKSRGPKGPQPEVGARKSPRLLVFGYCFQ